MGWLLNFFLRILLPILVVTRIYRRSSLFSRKITFPKYLFPSLMFSLILLLLWKNYYCRPYQCPNWSQNLLGLLLDDYQSGMAKKCITTGFNSCTFIFYSLFNFCWYVRWSFCILNFVVIICNRYRVVKYRLYKYITFTNSFYVYWIR